MERPKIIASALIEKDGKFLLVKEILEDSKEYWIIPGGKVEFGETLAEALKREIKEEIDVDIEVLKFIDFKESIHRETNYHTVIFFFLARLMNENLVLDEKIVDAKFFTLEQAKNLNLVDTARWILENYAKLKT